MFEMKHWVTFEPDDATGRRYLWRGRSTVNVLDESPTATGQWVETDVFVLEEELPDLASVKKAVTDWHLEWIERGDA